VPFAALVAFIPMRLAGVDGGALGRTFSRTCKQLAAARTGVLCPFFAAFLGMIGVFLTGLTAES